MNDNPLLITIGQQADEITRLKDEVKKYHELIMEVANKYPGETRHETALRYIRNAEKVDTQASATRSS